MFKEIIDQSLHYLLGYMMARSLRGLMTRQAVISSVMSFAETREELQHPGECGPGCQLDLKWWRKGAEAGAGKK